MGPVTRGSDAHDRAPLEHLTGHRIAPGPEAVQAAPPSLVVIVAASRSEQQRLLAGLPEDVAVLVTTTREQAEELLHSRPGPSVLPPAPHLGLTVRSEERTVSFGDRSVRLTPLEFALLRTLFSEPGRIWSFPELSQRVWATGFVGDGAQVRAVVKRLRRKLAEAQAPVVVETVRGSGFRLSGPAPEQVGPPGA